MAFFFDVSTSPVVILERIEPGQPEPDYCIHGRTVCVECDEWCWLGSETFKVVNSRQALPLCIQCATRLFPPDARPDRTIRDHRVADGPHEP